MKINYPYMLVENSIWPLASSLSVLSLLIGVTSGKMLLVWMSLISVLISISYWWREVIIEGTYQGLHSEQVQKNLTIGFILFVISEAMVFFSLFFAYFYNCTPALGGGPHIFIGGVWPPVGIEMLDAGAIPLLNTVILFMSGVSVTAAQHSTDKKGYIYLLITIMLGVVFLILQYIEYINSLFTISDSVYGASFYFLTGFHGIHVLIGVIFLLVSLIRLGLYHYSSDRVGLNATFASIYYHFVDVIWIFLYAVIYCNIL
jgi:cytochrome c oxidase subunit 3